MDYIKNSQLLCQNVDIDQILIMTLWRVLTFDIIQALVGLHFNFKF